jgi:hypothetical protein
LASERRLRATGRTVIVTGKATLDRMVADGDIDIETAHQVDRFAAFLRAVSLRSCVCDKGVRDDAGEVIAHAHVDAATYAYAHGEDVDPPGTGEPW